MNFNKKLHSVTRRNKTIDEAYDMPKKVGRILNDALTIRAPAARSQGVVLLYKEYITIEYWFETSNYQYFISQF